MVNKNISSVGGFISSGSRTNLTDARFRGQEYTVYSSKTTHQYEAFLGEAFDGFRCDSCGALADRAQCWDASASEIDAVTATLTPKTDGSSTLTFTGFGAMTDYSSVTQVPWRHYYPTVSEIVFGDGITHISQYGFDYFNGITSLSLPKSVVSIGEYAFRRCENLISVTIPASVTAIGDYNFRQCDNLTVYGTIGSEAERFATENAVPFAPIGDMNADAALECTDAVYLLYHTMLPEQYPIEQNGDIDGSGTVDGQDAVYLLYHILLPTFYPL